MKKVKWTKEEARGRGGSDGPDYGEDELGFDNKIERNISNKRRQHIVPLGQW